MNDQRDTVRNHPTHFSDAAASSRIDASLALSIGLALLLGSLVLRLNVPLFYGQSQLWRKYYTASVSSGAIPPKRLARVLAPLGAASRYTTFVRLSLIDEIRTIPLSEIPGRLIDKDPRLDPFLAAVDGYFSAGDRELFYPEARLPPGLMRLRLARLLGVSPARVRLAEWPLGPIGLRLLMCMATLILFAGGRRGSTVLLLSGIVPIGFLAVQGGVWGGVAGVVTAAGWGVFASGLEEALLCRLRGERSGLLPALGKREIVAGAGSVTSAILMTPIHPRPGVALLSVGLMIVGVVGLVLVAAGVHAVIRSRTAHPIFRPRSVLPYRFRPFSGRKLTGTVLALATMLVVVDSTLTRIGNIGVPVPRGSHTAKNYSWGELEKLYYERGGRDLPSIADYVAHAAYQQSIYATRDYGFPIDGRTVEIGTYRRLDGRIIRTDRVLEVFDSIWFLSVLSEARSGGVTRMLLSQRRPVIGARIDAPGWGRIIGAVAVVGVGLLCFFLTWTQSGASLTAVFFYGMRNSLHRRRHQIA